MNRKTIKRQLSWYIIRHERNGCLSKLPEPNFIHTVHQNKTFRKTHTVKSARNICCQHNAWRRCPNFHSNHWHHYAFQRSSILHLSCCPWIICLQPKTWDNYVLPDEGECWYAFFFLTIAMDNMSDKKFLNADSCLPKNKKGWANLKWYSSATFCKTWIGNRSRYLPWTQYWVRGIAYLDF